MQPLICTWLTCCGSAIWTAIISSSFCKVNKQTHNNNRVETPGPLHTFMC